MTGGKKFKNPFIQKSKKIYNENKKGGNKIYDKPQIRKHSINMYENIEEFIKEMKQANELIKDVVDENPELYVKFPLNTPEQDRKEYIKMWNMYKKMYDN